MQNVRLHFTIGDLLEIVAERQVDDTWMLKEGIDLNAPVLIIGAKALDQSDLTAIVSEEDGSLCIMEA